MAGQEVMYKEGTVITDWPLTACGQIVKPGCTF